VAVVVNVGLTEMLVFSVFVRQVGMRKHRVIVLVCVQRRKVLPLAQELVRALASVMGHVRVLVRVNDGIVAMLDVID
jgi:hypothetical protein